MTGLPIMWYTMFDYEYKKSDKLLPYCCPDPLDKSLSAEDLRKSRMDNFEKYKISYE